jgi:Rrf2 family cysteine metabolism transcriptional repressor
MVYLALRKGDTPVAAQEIAREEGLSEDYTEQLLAKLKAAGLVTSKRGAKGGFSLARDTGEVAPARIIEAVDGPVELVRCISEGCERETTCATRELWREANDALLNVLEKYTLDDLARRAREAAEAQAHDYQI